MIAEIRTYRVTCDSCPAATEIRTAGAVSIKPLPEGWTRVPAPGATDWGPFRHLCPRCGAGAKETNHDGL